MFLGCLEAFDSATLIDTVSFVRRLSQRRDPLESGKMQSAVQEDAPEAAATLSKSEGSVLELGY